MRCCLAIAVQRLFDGNLIETNKNLIELGGA